MLYITQKTRALHSIQTSCTILHRKHMHNFTQETHALYYTESLMYYITMETHKPHYTRIHSQHHTGNTHKKYTHYITQ